MWLCFLALAAAQINPQALYESGQRDAALSQQAFEKLLKIAPESAYVLALLGEVKTQDRQYTAALYAYTEAAKRMPAMRGVRAKSAAIYDSLGKPVEAAAARAAEQKLGPVNCASEKLQCAFDAGRFEEVVKAAQARNNAEGFYWLSRAYNELAEQSFAELGKLPESPELHRVKGQILSDQDQFREAAEEWRVVLKFSPGDRDAQHQLATALYQSHNFKAVLPELRQFLNAEPDSANLNFFVGDSLLETEQIEPAVPYLEKALRLDPKLLPAHAALGLCYGRLGQAQKAIPHLKTALSLDKDGGLHYQLARAYQATGQPALAKTMMEEYQRLKAR